MSRAAKKEESTIQIDALEDDSIQQAIQLFKDIASTSRGPFGKIKVIQNSVGGHMTLTSSSSRILNAMSFSKPIIRFISSAAQSHLSHFSDGGLFFIMFCLNLVQKSLSHNISRRSLTEIYEELLNLSIDILKSDGTSFSGKLQISNIKHMSCLVKSILQSKPLCGLYGKNLDFIVSLILQAFLISIPESGTAIYQTDGIYIVCCEGSQSSESKIYCGLLIEFPEIPPYIDKDLTLKRNGEGEISVAIVTISMAGDTEEVLDARYQINNEVYPETVLITKMLEFCDWLSVKHVGVLFCQKVVHPKVKKYLKSKDIFVVERLGLQLIGYVKDLTAANPLASFSSLSKTNIGILKTMKHEVLNEKSYLHLTGLGDRMCSLVLCSPQEETVTELKTLCQATFRTLRNLLQNPSVLAGGGCWETSLAFHLKKRVFENKSKLMEKMTCSWSVLQTACNVFTQSLEAVAMSTGEDGDNHMTSNSIPHHWKFINVASDSVGRSSCCCGAYKVISEHLQLIKASESSYTLETFNQLQDNNSSMMKCLEDNNLVLDLSVSCQNALKMAVYTANHILGIGQFIHDVN